MLAVGQGGEQHRRRRAVIGRVPIPAIIARTGEAVEQDLVFVPHKPSGGVRLSYRRPNPRTDWVDDMLVARVRDTKRGEPLWRMLNRKRQWRQMLKNRCQVCEEVAIDPVTRRIWWVITETAFRATEANGNLTNAPPTCLACIPAALTWCPQLQKSATVYTVARSEPSGVLADMFEPGPGGEAIHVGHNVYVGWDEFARHPYALALQLVVQLIDMRPADVSELPQF